MLADEAIDDPARRAAGKGAGQRRRRVTTQCLRGAAPTCRPRASASARCPAGRPKRRPRGPPRRRRRQPMPPAPTSGRSVTPRDVGEQGQRRGPLRGSRRNEPWCPPASPPWTTSASTPAAAAASASATEVMVHQTATFDGAQRLDDLPLRAAEGERDHGGPLAPDELELPLPVVIAPARLARLDAVARRLASQPVERRRRARIRRPRRAPGRRRSRRTAAPSPTGPPRARLRPRPRACSRRRGTRARRHWTLPP